MAGKTDFLDLVLAANNEFNNTWDVPVNENFQKIDVAIEDISNEISAARFTKTTLAEFLVVAHFSDGTLRPSEEQRAGRNSPIYGDDSGGNDFTLSDRLDRADFELYDAREDESNLLDNLAKRLADRDYLDSPLSGPADNNGAPNYLSSSGAEFQVNGDPDEITFNIGGYLMKVREDLNVPVTGADGIKYLVARRPATPFVQFNRNTQQAAATTSNPLNGDKVQVIVDTGQDFAAQGVRPGMKLVISNTDNAGTYIIDQVGFDGNPDQLLIVGIFPVAIASINYLIQDQYKPEFAVLTDYVETLGDCYIGEGEFVGGSLISDLSYAYKKKYESPFTSVDVSTVAIQEVVLNHNLGFVPKKVHIYATETNDGLSPFEPLSVSEVDNDLSVTIDNTLVYTPESYTQAVFDEGTTDATFEPGELTDGSLDGDVTGTIDGEVFIVNSVRVRITRTQIFIKNIRDNLFYRDYDGTDKQVGFLKVVCE
jgi:hypothetical protein